MTTLFQGWNNFHRVTLRVADAKGHETTVTHSVEDHGDGVAIFAYDPNRRIGYLVRQLRTPVAYTGSDGSTLELPAGGRGDDSPIDAARRELREEIGLDADDLQHVGAGHPMPGVSTELTHLFLAIVDLTIMNRKTGGIHAEGEYIDIVEMPLWEFPQAIQDGRIRDLKAITLTYLLMTRRPYLFQHSVAKTT